MSLVAGPRLDAMSERLRMRYATTRLRLIQKLEQGGVYNTVKLSTDEQVHRFVTMQPQDYEAMVVRLNNRYRGLPNAYELVNRDLATFMRRMIGLMLTRGFISEDQFQAEGEDLMTTLEGMV